MLSKKPHMEVILSHLTPVAAPRPWFLNKLPISLSWATFHNEVTDAISDTTISSDSILYYLPHKQPAKNTFVISQFRIFISILLSIFPNMDNKSNLLVVFFDWAFISQYSFVCKRNHQIRGLEAAQFKSRGSTSQQGAQPLVPLTSISSFEDELSWEVHQITIHWTPW